MPEAFLQVFETAVESMEFNQTRELGRQWNIDWEEKTTALKESPITEPLLELARENLERSYGAVYRKACSRLFITRMQK